MFDMAVDGDSFLIFGVGKYGDFLVPVATATIVEVQWADGRDGMLINGTNAGFRKGICNS